MKNIFKLTLLAFTALLLSNCESTELDLLDNPNQLNPSSADANFILNSIQLDFNSIMNGFSNASSGVIRQRNQFGTYNDAADNSALNATTGEWATTYRLSANVDALETLSEATEGGLPYQLGVAQVIKAYSFVTLVDYVGDIPFSEANQQGEFPFPNADPGSSVYAAMHDLLDEAITNLSSPSAPNLLSDLYFDNDVSKWKTLANTLKLKMYNQTRLVTPTESTSGINSILATNDYIDEISEDFQFQYGTTADLPESRHPLYRENYLTGAGTRMSNYLYDLMNVGSPDGIFVENGTVDPRSRYYFYRQTSTAPSGSNLPCEGNGAYDYCYVGNEYWGRDHADDEGLPSDGTSRTVYGIYPAGGAFDRNLYVTASSNSETLSGAGIAPLLLSSYTNFMLAEAALTLGTNGSASTYLEDGIRDSMNKVSSFGNPTTTDETDNTIDYGADAASINAYVASVLGQYNSADTNGKLEIIAREYYIAAFGNGIEPYITYKRTGKPNLQAPVVNAGPFPRSFAYPSDEVTANPNIDQQIITSKVFWDNNPDNFID